MATHVGRYQYRSSEWLLNCSPSRLDGVTSLKEDSLLWEVALLLDKARTIPARDMCASCSPQKVVALCLVLLALLVAVPGVPRLGIQHRSLMHMLVMQ